MTPTQPFGCLRDVSGSHIILSNGNKAYSSQSDIERYNNVKFLTFAEGFADNKILFRLHRFVCVSIYMPRRKVIIVNA